MNPYSSTNRRKFLRGMGALVALPSLEYLNSAAKAAEKVGGATKMAFIYTPNGAIMPQWSPSGEGANWKLSSSLASLEPMKKDIQVISGLAHDKANANGDGGGDHARANATFLTGMQARKT